MSRSAVCAAGDFGTFFNVALKRLKHTDQIYARGVALSAPAAMAAERGVETRARKRKRVLDAAQLAIAIPNLPFDVVVSHVFRETHLPDPADLGSGVGLGSGFRV
jgi:hypothetical protein